MNTTLDMMTPMDAMDAVISLVQPTQLTKATAHDVWVCAFKGSLALDQGDRAPVGRVVVIEQDDTTWTVEVQPKNNFAQQASLAKSIETFRGYLWGYGRKPVVNGNCVTIAKVVDPRDVRSR